MNAITLPAPPSTATLKSRLRHAELRKRIGAYALILPLALYFVWEGRAALRRIEPRPSLSGAGLLAAGLLMLVVGYFAPIPPPAAATQEAKEPKEVLP